MKKKHKTLKIFLLIIVIIIVTSCVVVIGVAIRIKSKDRQYYENVVNGLAKDSMLDKNLLGMKLKKQSIKSKSALMYNKTFDRVTNTYYFPDGKTPEQMVGIFKQKLQDEGWGEIKVSDDEESFYIRSFKKHLYIKIHISKSKIIIRLNS